VTYKIHGAQILSTLGDPTRRTIFERLARGPSAVGEIARDMPVIRPAVSQHLRVLKEAGLVSETNAGARRIYRLDPRGIAAMRDWLDDMWSAALENFRAFADAQGEPDPASPKSERNDK